MDNRAFAYGGKHFVPVRKFEKKMGTFTRLHAGLRGIWSLAFSGQTAMGRTGRKRNTAMRDFMRHPRTKPVIFSGVWKMEGCMSRVSMSCRNIRSRRRTGGGIMSDEKEKQMVENYKITQGIPIGDKEVVLGVDEKAEMPYLCAFYTSNELFGSYTDCMVGNDYVAVSYTHLLPGGYRETRLPDTVQPRKRGL